MKEMRLQFKQKQRFARRLMGKEFNSSNFKNVPAQVVGLCGQHASDYCRPTVCHEEGKRMRYIPNEAIAATEAFTTVHASSDSSFMLVCDLILGTKGSGQKLIEILLRKDLPSADTRLAYFILISTLQYMTIALCVLTEVWSIFTRNIWSTSEIQIGILSLCFHNASAFISLLYYERQRLYLDILCAWWFALHFDDAVPTIYSIRDHRIMTVRKADFVARLPDHMDVDGDFVTVLPVEWIDVPKWVLFELDKETPNAG
ncbi:hypothetical protein TTRE_0000539201 [Trichuris trichiura]|uniref:Uncharacterized protein n=1 Tax=Trichuris trichiura TaxID=36087 RepID=A0A077Z9L4_TRITR|nr:hypothetical protein TTRE_0000539201 [Trichuris trichiura]